MIIRIPAQIFSLLFLLLNTLGGALLAEETVRIQLKWYHQFQFAGYYAAIEQGYFADEGLHVELIERDPTVNNILQVLQGEVDYGIADSALLLYRDMGAGVHIVAPIFQYSPNVIITLASSGIVSPEDLIGQRLRLYSNETEGFPIMAMLAEQGVLQQGIIRQPYSSELDTLIRGETDAIFGYSSNEPYLFHERDIDVQLIHPAHYGINMYGDMLFTSVTEARERPERMAAVRRAVLRGWEYALDHKEAISQLILDQYSQRKSFAALMYEANALEQAIARFTVPIGTLDRGRIEHIANIYARHGLLDEHFSVNDQVFFDRSREDKGLNLSADEIAFLAQHRHIRVAVDRDWFPMDFVDEHNHHAGIAADYLSLLAKRLGVTFEVETRYPWTRVMDMVRNRELDMFAMAAKTPERAKYVNFTRPYIRSPMVIVTNNEVDYIDGATGLQHKVIAVVRDYASHEWLRSNHPELELRLMDTTIEGLESVATGEVFAFVDNLASVSFLIKQQGLSNLKVSGQLPIAFDLSMGVRSDWPLLQSILQKGLDSISTAEKDAIYDKWIRLEIDSAIDYRKVAPYFLGLVFILALVGLDSLRMRRMHRRLHLANLKLRRAEKQLIDKNDELEKLSTTDKLTDSYNRLKLDAELHAQRALTERYHRPLSLVLFDLDNFKQVNDTYGHHTGDEVLKVFSSLVRQTVRKTDIFGRWGGEEFMLICPETDEQTATELADRIRKQLAMHPFPEGFSQTVSGGAVQYQAGQSLSEWVISADKLLYQAKQAGRNRILCG